MHVTARGLMKRTILSYGEFAYGEEDPEVVADWWIEEAFTARQASDWLDAKVFRADDARRLENCKITPAQVKEAGIGYAYANGDVSLEEVIDKCRGL